MLSKEKIEKAKQNFKEEIDNEIKVYSLVNDYTQSKTDNHKIILEYIEQLETEKQKLIDKLEEDKKKWQEFHNRVPEVPEYIDYILPFVKGEDDESKDI